MSAVSAGYNDVLGLLRSRGVDAKFANVNRQIPLHYHKGGWVINRRGEFESPGLMLTGAFSAAD